MATPEGGTKTPFSTQLVNLVANGAINWVRGVFPDSFFGPGQPLPSVAPKDQNLRAYDYPFGVNLDTRPRQTESGIEYNQLRALADSYDLLRLVIETRKDQVVAIPQSFRLRPEDGESRQSHRERSAKDPRIKALNRMFRYPDGIHDWRTWIRAALEETFVIDALSLAPQYTLDGSVTGLDIISGDTIVRKIDIDGRTPPPPSVAYQQILKGLPAKDVTTRDLIYVPRNYRVHKLYGYGPVEQIIITVNMALRRQGTQLSYFTEGNIPEAVAQVPDGWTPADIKVLQTQFDNLAGNIAKKSRIRFIPKMDGFLFSKDKILMDQFDEWLARIVCFAFSLSPQPFTKMMNRSTATTANEQAQQEGLVPILDFISMFLTMFVERYLLIDDIEHAFMDDEEADKLKQAQIDKIYASYAKESVDEQRARDGQDPIGLGPMVFTATGPVPITPFLKGGPMAEGLPQHAKSPEELDQEKKDNQDHADKQQQLSLNAPPAKGNPPANKLNKASKKNY